MVIWNLDTMVKEFNKNLLDKDARQLIEKYPECKCQNWEYISSINEDENFRQWLEDTPGFQSINF